MRYQKTVEVDPQVFANLQKFTQTKSQKVGDDSTNVDHICRF